MEKENIDLKGFTYTNPKMAGGIYYKPWLLPYFEISQEELGLKKTPWGRLLLNLDLDDLKKYEKGLKFLENLRVEGVDFEGDVIYLRHDLITIEIKDRRTKDPISLGSDNILAFLDDNVGSLNSSIFNKYLEANLCTYFSGINIKDAYIKALKESLKS